MWCHIDHFVVGTMVLSTNIFCMFLFSKINTTLQTKLVFETTTHAVLYHINISSDEGFRTKNAQGQKMYKSGRRK